MADNLLLVMLQIEYRLSLKGSKITDRLDRLTVEKKKEWTMGHLLNLIIEKELRDKLEDLLSRAAVLQTPV